MPAKKIPYVHRFTGDVKILTKQEGKKLSEDWSRVEFVKNDEGVQVMRIQLNGATVDVSENETKEVIDGEPITK
jgi:hypothetical protein